MESLVFLLILGVVAFGAPLWAMWRWRGGWRLAAAVPALGMLLEVIRLVIGIWRDPTSNNLWPLGILMFGGLGAIYIAVLRMVRRFNGVER